MLRILIAPVLALALVQVASAQTATVPVGDFYFCEPSADDCVTTVTAGDSLAWSYQEGTAGHTVTACGQSCDSPTGSPAFDSGRILAGDVFSATFDTPGTYLYYCEFHPQAMRGTVVVQAQPAVQQTPTPAPDPTATPVTTAASPTLAATPTPTPEPSPAPTVSPAVTPSPLPDSDGDDGGISLLWLILGGTLAAGAIAAAGVLYRLRRGA